MEPMTFATMGQALASNAGIELHLVGPDGATPLYAVEHPGRGWIVTTDEDAKGALPCTFTIVGQDSKAYRRRRHELVDALRSRQKTLKSAQIEEETMKVVSAAVIGWSGIPWTDAEGKGYLLSYSDDNLLMFLDKYRPAFDQVNEAVADRARFLKLA